MTHLVNKDYPTVGGLPTLRLQCGNISSRNVLVMIIPGNPGVAQYYEEFMAALHTASGHNLPICCISHAGHGIGPSSASKSNSNDNFLSLEGQIKHKLCYINEHIPTNTPLIFIGHSIGCYMILHLLEKLESNRVAKCIMLFPTIERMALSPKGKSTTPFLKYLRWMIPIPTLLLYYLVPDSIKEGMVRWYFKGKDVPECAVQSTLKIIDATSLQNITSMANQEMHKVVHADNDIIEKHVKKLMWYYGADDHWCPVEYYEDMRNRFPNMDMFLCKENYDHAFVLKDSSGMAHFVGKWMHENVTELANGF